MMLACIHWQEQRMIMHTSGKDYLMSWEKEHQPIVIYPDRGKLLRANGITFLLGGGLALLALTPWHNARVVTRMLIMLSRVLLLLWGWFSIPVLARLLFP